MRFHFIKIYEFIVLFSHFFFSVNVGGGQRAAGRRGRAVPGSVRRVHRVFAELLMYLRDRQMIRAAVRIGARSCGPCVAAGRPGWSGLEF